MRRQGEQNKFNAALHGRILENRIESDEDEEQLSEAQLTAMNKALSDAQERKRKEFANNGR